MSKPKINSIESLLITNEKVISALDYISRYFDSANLTEEEAFTVGAHICGVSMERFLDSGRISPEDIFHNAAGGKNTTTALAKKELNFDKKIVWGAKKTLDSDDYS